MWAMRGRHPGAAVGVQPRPGLAGPARGARPGGRAITVLDGDLVVLSPDGDPDRLVRGRRRAGDAVRACRSTTSPTRWPAAAAALGLALPARPWSRGCARSRPDPLHNPGRMNVYSVPVGRRRTATVVIDLAHNEAGLEALLRRGRGARAPRAAACTSAWAPAGDRTDEILQALGEIAGRRRRPASSRCTRSTTCAAASMDDLEAQLRIGLAGWGSATSSRTRPSSTGCRPWSPPPTTATWWR